MMLVLSVLREMMPPGVCVPLACSCGSGGGLASVGEGMMVESGTTMESLRADNIFVKCRRCRLPGNGGPQSYMESVAYAGKRVAEMKALKSPWLRGKGGHRRLER